MIVRCGHCGWQGDDGKLMTWHKIENDKVIKTFKECPECKGNLEPIPMPPRTPIR